MNADKLSFDRLFDRAYQPVNNQPFGHNITLCYLYGLRVSFIDALSQWRKQFNLSFAFIISSASIIVTNASFHLFHRINADER